jgi:hypothetical protein
VQGGGCVGGRQLPAVAQVIALHIHLQAGRQGCLSGSGVPDRTERPQHPRQMLLPMYQQEECCHMILQGGQAAQARRIACGLRTRMCHSLQEG